ncbi:MAG: ribosome-associated translation inhibitor RaiA [Bacteriovoracaceae bacterium]|jgi:ribosome-associated translation inhibitor RaiA
MNKEITEELEKIKEHLEKMAPEAVNIDVGLNKKDAGFFESKIKVRLPKRKLLVINKKSLDPFSSLFKGHQAILKQLEKEKSRMKLKRGGAEVFAA